MVVTNTLAYLAPPSGAKRGKLASVFPGRNFFRLVKHLLIRPELI